MSDFHGPFVCPTLSGETIVKILKKRGEEIDEPEEDSLEDLANPTIGGAVRRDREAASTHLSARQVR